MAQERLTPECITQFMNVLRNEIRSFAEEINNTSTVRYVPQGIKISFAERALHTHILLRLKDNSTPHYAKSMFFVLAHIVPSTKHTGTNTLILQRVYQIVQNTEHCLNKNALISFFSKGPKTNTSMPKVSDPTKEVSLKISMQCNTSCVFCAEQRSLSQQNNPHIHSKDIFEMIDRIQDCKRTSLSFDGGDPTLSPYLTQAIAYAHKKKFCKISIVTNGIRLADKAFLTDLTRAGLTNINFSLHAVDTQTSMRIYGAPIFTKQRKALTLIQALKKKIGLSIQTVVTSINAKSLTSILETAALYRPSEIIVIYVMIISFPNKKELLPNIHSGDLSRTLSAFQKKHPDIPIILRGFPFCNVPPAFHKKMQFSKTEPVRVTGTNRPEVLWKNNPNKKSCKTCHYANTCMFPLHEYCSVYTDTRKLFIPIPL